MGYIFDIVEFLNMILKCMSGDLLAGTMRPYLCPMLVLSKDRFSPSYTWSIYGKAHVDGSFTSHSSLTPAAFLHAAARDISLRITHGLSSKHDLLSVRTPRR